MLYVTATPTQLDSLCSLSMERIENDTAVSYDYY